MYRNINHQKINRIFVFIIVTSIIALAGCNSQETTVESTKSEPVAVVNKIPKAPESDTNLFLNGLPKAKFQVGGGLLSQWRTPKIGMIYVVEESTKKIVLTKFLDSDELFNFNFDTISSGGFEDYLGGDLTKLNFSLYFIPLDDFAKQY